MSCVGLKQSDVTGMMVRWSSPLRCACVMNSRRGGGEPHSRFFPRENLRGPGQPAGQLA